MLAKHTLSHALPALIGVVLAAGRGRRFDPGGHRVKLRERLADGRSVLRASCEGLAPWVDELRVVVGAHNTEILKELEGIDFKTVVCPNADEGMSASLACGLSGELPQIGWLIALGDMPGIAARTYEHVGQALREGAVAARPVSRGQPGHPVGVAASLCARLRQVQGPKGLGALLNSRDVGTVRLDVDDPGCVLDVDRPEHLRQFD